MYIVRWNKDLETGIELVDHQHFDFFKHANKFFIQFATEKKIRDALEQLNFLEDFLMYHCQTEEAFMYRSSYPAYLEHRAEHKYLSFKVKEMSIALRDENRGIETMDLFAAFINEWLATHIMESDIAFSRFYKEFIQRNP